MPCYDSAPRNFAVALTVAFLMTAVAVTLKTPVRVHEEEHRTEKLSMPEHQDDKGHCRVLLAWARPSLCFFRYVEHWLGSTSPDSTDATGTSARFRQPAIPCIHTGTLALIIPVSRRTNHQSRTNFSRKKQDNLNYVMRQADAVGEVTTLSGDDGNSGFVDGIGTAASHSNPFCSTFDSVWVFVFQTHTHTHTLLTSTDQHFLLRLREQRQHPPKRYGTAFCLGSVG